MADLRRSLSTPGETERRYSLITRATLGLYIDSQGYDVNEDVIRVLTEDVNYRLRELVSEAAQYMKHSRRTRLHMEDIQHTIADASVSPLIGNLADAPLKFVHLPDLQLHVPDDRPINLSVVANKEIRAEPARQLHLDSGWLASSACRSQNTPSMDTMQCLSNYFTEVTEACAGGNRQLRKVALADLVTNPRLRQIQGHLLSFITRWAKTSRQMGKSLFPVLEMLDALTNNHTIFIATDKQISILKKVLLEDIILNDKFSDQENARRFATNILIKCLRLRFVSPSITQQIVKRCELELSNLTSGEPSTCGAVMMITGLQPEMILDVFTEEFLHKWLDMDHPDVRECIVDSLRISLTEPILNRDAESACRMIMRRVQLHIPHLMFGDITQSTKPESNRQHKKCGLRPVNTGRVLKQRTQQHIWFSPPTKLRLRQEITIRYGNPRSIVHRHEAKDATILQAQTQTDCTHLYRKFRLKKPRRTRLIRTLSDEIFPHNLVL